MHGSDGTRMQRHLCQYTKTTIYFFIFINQPSFRQNFEENDLKELKKLYFWAQFEYEESISWPNCSERRVATILLSNCWSM